AAVGLVSVGTDRYLVGLAVVECRARGPRGALDAEDGRSVAHGFVAGRAFPMRFASGRAIASAPLGVATATAVHAVVVGGEEGVATAGALLAVGRAVLVVELVAGHQASSASALASSSSSSTPILLRSSMYVCSTSRASSADS